MILEKMLSPLLIKKVTGDTTMVIRDIQTDSRNIRPGDLFIAISGHRQDGHDHIGQAIENGASAVLLEKERFVPSHVTSIVVPDSKQAMAFVASAFFGYPSEKLTIIGVTGTNGKTTTTNLLEHVFSSMGHKTGVIGTIHNKIDDIYEESVNTTPMSLDLQRLLHRMVEKGVTHVLMEVSSHSLVEGRVCGVSFDSALFTNLTQDHLDFHGSMDEYRQAKGLLFAQLGNDAKGGKAAILNRDDPAWTAYKEASPAEVVTYGIDNKADFHVFSHSITASGTNMDISTPFGIYHLESHLIGKFNIYNLLSAIAACSLQGVPMEAVLSALSTVKGVAGRFETVNAGQDFLTIVDYAHTPDSLDNVLSTIAEFAKGKIYCVVGCGGNRDKTKRPLMAAIAGKFADLTILTSDNPRFEDTEDILLDMEKGMQTEAYIKLVDRKEAIEHAISLAAPGDVVLIAGKGHETYQIIGDTKHHFSDKEIAEQLIMKK